MNQPVLNADPLDRPDEGPFVPEVIRIPPSEFVPARRVGLIRSILAYWPLPHRFGPYLVHRSLFVPSLIAILAGTICVAGFGFIWATSGYYNGYMQIGSPRVIFARRLGAIIRGAGITGASDTALLAIVGSPLFFAMGAIFWGLIIMPWASSNSKKQALRRAINNGLLITTIFPVALAVIAISMPPSRQIGFGIHRASMYLEDLVCFHIVPMFTILLVIRSSILGAHAIPFDADAQDTIAPRCEACGYHIVGLSVNSACPECGTLVAESFDDGRRIKVRDQMKAAMAGSWAERLRLIGRLMYGRSTFEVLPVYEQKLAREIWWYSLFICGVIVEAAILITLNLPNLNRDQQIMGVVFFQGVFVFLFVAHSVNLFSLVGVGRGKHGIENARVSVSVGNFASPMLILPVLIVVLGSGLPTWIESFIAGTELEVMLHRSFDLTFACICVVLISLVVTVAWWLSCTRYGLRHARYANY